MRRMSCRRPAGLEPCRGRVWLVGALLACTLASPDALAVELGRLFSTPAQRQALDQARERYDPTRQEVIVRAGEAVVEEAPPPLPELSVEGVVIRSDGNNATWINGTGMLSGESTAEGIRVEADGSGGTVRFVLPDGRDAGRLRPGQTLDPNVGRVTERYAPRPADEDAVEAEPPATEGSGQRPAG